MGAQEFILKPVTIKNILLLSPGKWNDVDYEELELLKAFNSTDWNDRKYTSLYLDHQDTKDRGVGNWVGYVKNQRLENSASGKALYGDLEVWNPMIAAYLSQAKAKFGVSATLAGRENKQLNRMEDFHFESFSIVTDPACKPAMINLQDKQINMVTNSDVKVVTMENETTEDLVELESLKHQERRENIESVNDKKDFCSALKSALVDEKKAPGDYENLKSLTDDEEVKKTIDGIISDEKRHHALLENIQSKKELANEGSPTEIHALEPVKIEKKKKEDEEELGAKFERQVSHISDSLKKSHPNWTPEKIKEVAYATANKMKDLCADLTKIYGEQVDFKSLSEINPSLGDKTSIMENSESISLKGGLKIPENMENESVKVELEATKTETLPVASETLASDKKDEKKKEDEDKEDEKEMSSETILNKIKEMSAEELMSYTNFVKAYLSENTSASAKEVTLAYEKSKVDKKSEKELSANDLLASLDSRIASIKELDSSKKIAEMETKIQELSAKVKAPDRKTLSLAFDRTSTDSNLGMLNFLQHRIN